MLITLIFALAVIQPIVNGSGRELKFFNEGVLDSLNDFTQTNTNNEATSDTGNANSGNQFGGGDIVSIQGTPPDDQFGVGFGQFTEDNEATTTGGTQDANSGNQLDIGNIEDTTAIIDQDAYDNEADSNAGDSNAGNEQTIGNIADSTLVDELDAEGNLATSGGDGDANAGNDVEFGDVTDSDVDLDSSARYNRAYTDSGDANAGNIGNVGDISGGSFDGSQDSTGNIAGSDSGNANSGNILNFGNLTGKRKLMKYH